MTIQEQLIAAGMNPNFIPVHKQQGFDPTNLTLNGVAYKDYVIAPATMKDANGNDIPGNPYYDEELAFWETQPLSRYCNNAVANCDDGSSTTIDDDIEIEEMELEDATTAGSTKIPTMVWYVLGAVALYYVGKKQKWF